MRRRTNVVRLATVIALMAIATAANAEDAALVGRYQIVVVPSGQSLAGPLLLDTTTGRVWSADVIKTTPGPWVEWRQRDRGNIPDTAQAGRRRPLVGGPDRPAAAIVQA